MTKDSADGTGERLKHIDDLIREGNGKGARTELAEIAKTKVPRAHAARTAWLAWRADLPQLGLRLLNPIVRPPARVTTVATDEEKAEYAQCLVRIGAREEARALLESVAPEKFPRAYLYLGAIHVARWDYAAAIPLFVASVGAAKRDSYQSIVARVNLAAAYVHERKFPQAGALLRGLLHETSVRRLTLLHGNVLGLSAESFLLQRNWREAEKYIRAAKESLRDSAGLDALIVRKWEAFLALQRGRGQRRPSAGLLAVRKEAHRLGHWETVRECDRFLAVRFRSRKAFLKVYFGTPFEKYREQLLRDWGGPISIPSDYLWRPEGSTGARMRLDAARGALDTGSASLKTGQSLHRLLLALSEDFYRPFRVAALFHAVFPDEHYNPITAGKRVYQAIALLREWLLSARVPLTVSVRGGEVRLQGTGSCMIRVERFVERASPATLRLRTLREAFGDREFSMDEAAAVLGVTGRTVLRAITGAMKEGSVERFGSRAYARYRLR